MGWHVFDSVVALCVGDLTVLLCVRRCVLIAMRWVHFILGFLCT